MAKLPGSDFVPIFLRFRERGYNKFYKSGRNLNIADCICAAELRFEVSRNCIILPLPKSSAASVLAATFIIKLLDYTNESSNS